MLWCQPNDKFGKFMKLGKFIIATYQIREHFAVWENYKIWDCLVFPQAHSTDVVLSSLCPPRRWSGAGVGIKYWGGFPYLKIKKLVGDSLTWKEKVCRLYQISISCFFDRSESYIQAFGISFMYFFIIFRFSSSHTYFKIRYSNFKENTEVCLCLSKNREFSNLQILIYEK